ncbi:MAG: UvrB/UvrC motif-containing protein [Verrucomicrobiota bacterium]
MICDVCKTKAATVYLTQIVNGQMQKVNLCEGCAKEKGVTDPTGFALAEMLLGLGTEKKLERSSDEASCDSCGFTQSDFKKTGRLGCSKCYRIFGDGLGSLLKAMHRGTKHVGKSPQKFQGSRDFSDRLEDLKHRLKIAVKDENFEEAAALRDQIRSAEEDLKKDAGKSSE